MSHSEARTAANRGPFGQVKNGVGGLLVTSSASCMHFCTVIRRAALGWRGPVLDTGGKLGRMIRCSAWRDGQRTQQTGVRGQCKMAANLPHNGLLVRNKNLEHPLLGTVGIWLAVRMRWAANCCCRYRCRRCWISCVVWDNSSPGCLAFCENHRSWSLSSAAFCNREAASQFLG